MNPRKDLSPELAALQDAPRRPPGARSTGAPWKNWPTREAFQELMRREFPEQAAVWPNPLSRRQFLTLMGASLALAGLSGCSVRPAPSVEARALRPRSRKRSCRASRCSSPPP